MVQVDPTIVRYGWFGEQQELAGAYVYGPIGGAGLRAHVKKKTGLD